MLLRPSAQCFFLLTVTRMSVVSPPSQSVLVAPFQTKAKVLVLTGKDEQKEEIPQFLVGSPLTATAGVHETCPQNARYLIVPI